MYRAGCFSCASNLRSGRFPLFPLDIWFRKCCSRGVTYGQTDRQTHPIRLFRSNKANSCLGFAYLNVECTRRKVWMWNFSILYYSSCFLFFSCTVCYVVVNAGGKFFRWDWRKREGDLSLADERIGT